MRCTFIYLVPAILILVSCGAPQNSTEIADISTIRGEAQGTSYSIKFLNPDAIEVRKQAIDSIFQSIDQSLSIWVEGSVISEFNRHDSITVYDAHFITVFERGRELSVLTEGAFHPMVAPLVRAWGFGPEGGRMKNGLNIDSLKALVSYDFDIVATDDASGLHFEKAPGMQLDVNSYAQGYAVDVLAAYLSAKGLRDMMVEVGGEVVARGQNAQGQAWRIGIDKPIAPEADRALQAAVALSDGALATSGTYRKFYEKDGKKYSHTIDPSTGKPVDHNLLSVTVLASNCTNADAMATAFMVMGVEKTKSFLAAHSELGLEVYLIFDQGEGSLATYTSQGWLEAVEEF
jgi:thiamine biosynthesis lipoprotein